MTENTFCRREKKLLVDTALVPMLQQEMLIYMEADSHNIENKPYLISNIYFDNDSDDCIRHSISKPSYKEKLRLRAYGIPSKNSLVFLEIKKKLNRVGTKRRAELTLQQAEEYLATGAHPPMLSYLNDQVLCEIDYYRNITGAVPKVYISYLRNAYFGRKDHSLRATFDSHILTRRHDLHLENGSYGSPLLPEGKTLLEIKFSGALPVWFAHLLSQYQLNFSSFSKYGKEYQKFLICNTAQFF